METFYGIFMLLGEPQRYGENGLSGKALFEINIGEEFKSPEEAVDYIKREKRYANSTDYYILPYIKYRKL